MKENNQTHPVLLTSLPRSGSTWVLRVLEQAPHTLAVFEPDHLDINGLGTNGVHPYIRAESEWPEYEAIYRGAFRGEKREPSILAINALRRKIQRAAYRFSPKQPRVIVKTVFSLHNTEWIVRRFSPAVVILLRNPYSLIHSINRKWPAARLKDLLVQEEFVEDYLEPYREVIESAQTPYEILATRVAAYYKAVLTCAEKHPSWIVITHEELCCSPLSSYERLYERVGLEWSRGVEKFIEATNKPKDSDRVDHVSRISSAEIDKWRNLLTQAQIDEISNYYRPFEIGYYDDYL